MQTIAWTDERLEERFDGIDRRFDRVEGELLELRREMRAGFATLESAIHRAEVGVIVSLIGVIGAILLKGV
jgi:hypothetical protein